MYNVTCKIDDWNIGLRRCPEKEVLLLGGPTLNKKKKKIERGYHVKVSYLRGSFAGKVNV